MDPTVSIGMPAYNGQTHIRQAIQSLQAQDLGDFELIVSDNGSTDATAEIVADLAARDSRIHLYRNARNIGAPANFSRVLEVARGTFFVWASCHDRWAPRFLSQCASVMQADDQVVLAYPRSAWIDRDDKVIGSLGGEIDTRGLTAAARFRRSVRRRGAQAIYGLFRRSAVNRTPIVRKALGPDNLLMAELAMIGAFAFVPDELFYMRKMGDFASWGSYFRKLQVELTRRTAARLCGDYVRNHLAIVRRYCPSRVRRWALSAWTAAAVTARSWPIFGAIMLEAFWPEAAGRFRRFRLARTR
jgi:glycosyltransferase involved in cell wall biosynthesis